MTLGIDGMGKSRDGWMDGYKWTFLFSRRNMSENIKKEMKGRGELHFFIS